MYIFLSILYAIVGGFIFWRLINKNKKNKIVGAYSGLVFGMIIYYIIVPILTMLNLNSLSDDVKEKLSYYTECLKKELDISLAINILNLLK